jgi:hypothetical protein
MQQAPLYAEPWWLDSTCGTGGWDAVICRDAKGNATTALPYHHTKIRGIDALITPPFTQWVSPIPPADTAEGHIRSLLSALPETPILDLCIKPGPDLHLEESIFPVALKYSFIVPVAASPEVLRSGYSEGLRRNLRQAEKLYSVRESGDIHEFLTLCHRSYQQQHIKAPFWLERVVPDVYAGLQAHHCGRLMMAYVQDKPIAGVLIAWDQATSYYLAGGRTGDEQGASAHALLLDHAVLAAHERGTAFDFEGSMHPGIANFFQSFGGIPAPYWHLRKFKGIGKVWSLFH